MSSPAVSVRALSDCAVGEELPESIVPITRALIVAGALATRDFQDVHHDAVQAVARGSKDIFMNILTTNGLVGQFVSAWAGPAATVRRIKVRLGAPNYPGDDMHLSGTVSGKDGDTIEVTVRGRNSLGEHVNGTVTVAYESPGAL